MTAWTDEKEAAVTVLLKEYEQLRAEINLFSEYRAQLLNATALIVAAFVTYAAYRGLPPSFDKSIGFPLALAVVFSVGSLLFAELRWRIFRVASYLHDEVRTTACEICGRDLLRWEDYVAHSGPLRGWRYKPVEHVGWLVFLIPAALFWFAALCELQSSNWCGRVAFIPVTMLLFYAAWVSIELMKFKVASSRRK